MADQPSVQAMMPGVVFVPNVNKLDFSPAFEICDELLPMCIELLAGEVSGFQGK
ncbi:MAG: hypothetical protein AAF745_12690 [Planctomycetota bacterium]